MKYFYSIILIIVIISCKEKPHLYTDEQVQIFTNEFDKYVNEKNEYLKTGDRSPLLDKDKPDFKGLHYFIYDPSFRFEGPIQKYAEPDTFIIYGSKQDDERPAIKFGYFDFTVKEQKCTIQIYKILTTNPDYQNYLFLGFTDETTNKTTYGAGRYIDLQVNPENNYIIDFNYAYNPYCAYNPKYSCAIPPQENNLPLAVEAGEKKYHD